VALTLLGGWGLDVEGGCVAVPDGTRRLLALLALRGPLSRPTTAAVLWPDQPPGHALARVRDAVSRAGRSAPGLVVSCPAGLALAADVDVDTRRCEAAARAVLDPMPETVPETLPEAQLEALVEAGELLPGWYDDWVGEERARLAALRLAALEAIAERMLDAGALGPALAAAVAATAVDPLAERPARITIRVHLAEGNVAVAVRTFTELRARLRAECGVEPGVRCRELVAAYLPPGR
jgi:DNA-binding SARP family transcriptional activator